MELLIQVLIAVLYFAFLLGSGSWAFGRWLGGPARGAAVPLMALPLMSDWLRFAGGLPFQNSFGIAAGIYLVLAAFCGWRGCGGRSPGEQPWRGYGVAIIALLAVHLIIRLWIFTERGPNPGDDTFGGYKAQALLHSSSWPTIHPEAPDLALSYYYYGFSWAAALAGLGVSLKAGWWVSALALCSVGGLLVIEAALPGLRNRRDLVLATITVGAGCSWSVVLALIQGIPPRFWLQEAGFLTQKFGLYMRVPANVGAYWAPFNVLTAGTLLAATLCLIEFIRGRWNTPRFVWTVLAVGSLPGYCTFNLIGFALVVVPVLTVFACQQRGVGALPRWLAYLGGLGASSVLAALPLLLDLAQRNTATRYDRFRDPLLVWFGTAFEKFSVLQVLGLALWTLGAVVLANILLIPVLARFRSGRLDPEATALLGIFGFGTVVCFFGVTDDFVPKFGLYVATALLVAFLRSGPWAVWERRIWITGLVVPTLLALYAVRANAVTPRWDRIWWHLDRIAAPSGEVVLYDVDYPTRRQRVPWVNVMPYFSRARLIVPAEQVDDQGQNFLRDPAELTTLPPTGVRLAAMMKGAPTYLLLTDPRRAAEGEELYRSEYFSLRRMPAPPVSGPSAPP